MTRITAIIFDTDFTAMIKVLKVKNGKVAYKDKEWYVDRTKPMTLQSAFGSNRPLYLLKWNTVIPMDFDVTNKTTTLVNPETGENLLLTEKNLKIIDNPEWVHDKKLPPPEALKMTADMRFLKQMKLGKEKQGFDIGSALPYIIAVGVAGLGMLFFLQSGGFAWLQKVLGFG